jgi:hypothetical protein
MVSAELAAAGAVAVEDVSNGETFIIKALTKQGVCEDAPE